MKLILISLIAVYCFSSCSKTDLNYGDHKGVMWTSVTDRYDIKTFEWYRRDTVQNWYDGKWAIRADSLLILPGYNNWGRYCGDTPHWVIHQFMVKGYPSVIPSPLPVPDSTKAFVLSVE